MADEGNARHQQSAASTEDDVALLEEEEGPKGLEEFEEDAVGKGETLSDEDLLKDSDPDVVALAEADDLLEGTEGEQFEVLDSVGDSLLDEEDPKTSDKKEGETGLNKEGSISPIVFDIAGKKRQRDSKEAGEPGGALERKKVVKMVNRLSDKLFNNTRYFIMKSNNYDNVLIAKDKCVWSTPPLNEKKLERAYADCRNVLLVFSVKESGKFQGIARLLSGARRDISPPAWVLPPGISSSSMAVFQLEWIHSGDLSFLHTLNLKNPWNDSKPVKISRDGQEVEPGVGEQLCRLWMEYAEPPSSPPPPSRDRPRRVYHHGSSAPPSMHHRQQTFPAPMPAMSMMPATMQLQYMQHAMMRGHAPFGVASVPTYNPMSGHAHSSLSAGSQLSSRSGSSSHSYIHSGSQSSRGRKSPSPRDRRRSRSRSPRRGGSGRRDPHHHDDDRHREREAESSRHRSSGSSRRDKRGSDAQEYSGIRKDILLNGSYEDYIKEYSSRHSSQSQLAPKEFEAMVEEFLNKKS